MCGVRTLPGNIKTCIFAVVHKMYSSADWLQICQILTDINKFCTAETGKMYNTGYAFTDLSLKESVGNDVINVSLFGSVCCGPRHWRMACVDAEGGHFEHYLWLLLSK